MKTRSLVSIGLIFSLGFALAQIAAGQTNTQRQSPNGLPIGRPEPWQFATDKSQIPPMRSGDSALNGTRGK